MPAVTAHPPAPPGDEHLLARFAAGDRAALDDLFRHWILGLGSGDLIVRTSGANSHEFHMPNVLSVSYKLRQIEEMQRDRPTVQG